MPFNIAGRLLQHVAPIQLLRVGSIYLIAIPGEVPSWPGCARRAVAAIVGADVSNVLCAGYSNAYIHYVTTPRSTTPSSTKVAARSSAGGSYPP